MTAPLQEITPRELAEQIRAGKKFTILDVREEWELTYAHINDERTINIPMSRIGRTLKEAFPIELRQPEADIVVMCHHGVRSVNVARWMIENGWQNVSNLTGGIAAYASEVDPSVGEY